MAAMPLTVDVVITAYGRYDLTDELPAPPRGARRVAHRVILVDNGSTDDTSASGGPRLPRSVDVSRCRRQPARSPSPRTRGVRRGDGDVVVLLNNDVDCRPDFLERLVAPLEADPRSARSRRCCVAPGEELIDSVGLTADPTLACFPRLQGQPVARGRRAEPRRWSGPAGAGGGLPARGLGGGRRARRDDLRLHGGLRPRAAAARSPAGRRRSRSTPWPCTSARRRTGTARRWQRRHGGFGRGYLLRRYGVLRGRAGAARAGHGGDRRAPATSSSRATWRRCAAASRGWRAGDAAAAPRPSRRPTRVDAAHLASRDSIDLRRGVYAQPRGMTPRAAGPPHLARPGRRRRWRGWASATPSSRARWRRTPT